MRRFAHVLALFALLTSSLFAADVSGKWTFHVSFRLGSGDPWFEFKQDGEKLTGMYHGRFGEVPLSGTVKGDQITFKFSDKRGDATYNGTIAGDTVKGSAKYPFPAGTGHFDGKRTK